MKAEKKFMIKAIEAAKESAKKGDYAIGSVVVKDGKVISIGYENLKSANYEVITGDFLRHSNLLRHDKDKLAKAILDI